MIAERNVVRNLFARQLKDGHIDTWNSGGQAHWNLRVFPQTRGSWRLRKKRMVHDNWFFWFKTVFLAGDKPDGDFVTPPLPHQRAQNFIYCMGTRNLGLARLLIDMIYFRNVEPLITIRLKVVNYSIS